MSKDNIGGRRKVNLNLPKSIKIVSYSSKKIKIKKEKDGHHVQPSGLKFAIVNSHAPPGVETTVKRAVHRM